MVGEWPMKAGPVRSRIHRPLADGRAWAKGERFAERVKVFVARSAGVCEISAAPGGVLGYTKTDRSGRIGIDGGDDV